MERLTQLIGQFTASDNVFWALTALLMLFAFALLVLLRTSGAARGSVHPDDIARLSEQRDARSKFID